MKEVANGAPEKNATLIYLRGCIPIQRIFYFIVGIPLVLCSTFVGKSLQVYLVLEKVSISNQRFSSFYTMITTSLYEHPSTSTAGFLSSGQSLKLQKQLSEHKTLSTHLGYTMICVYICIYKLYYIILYCIVFLDYIVIICNPKHHEIFALQIDPTWNSGRTNVRTPEGLALRPQPAPNQTAMFQGASGGH